MSGNLRIRIPPGYSPGSPAYEKQRLNDVIYTPENIVDNSYIDKYGSYTLDKLWESVVPFPYEPSYYVDQDYVLNVGRILIFSRFQHCLNI
jgi:hypothetical protein